MIDIDRVFNQLVFTGSAGVNGTSTHIAAKNAENRTTTSFESFGQKSDLLISGAIFSASEGVLSVYSKKNKPIENLFSNCL